MLEPEKIIGMDNYGPMFEQLYRGNCGSAVTGVNEYLTFVQAMDNPVPSHPLSES